MKIFRTIRNRLYSIWQSSVSEGFENAGMREAVEDATADYCEISSENLSNERGLVPLGEIWSRLEDCENRELVLLSALHHHLSLAHFWDDNALATWVRRKMTSRPFEEGWRNLPQWSGCETSHLRYLFRSTRDPMYRSPKFNGVLFEDFSVIDDVLPSHSQIALFGDWGTGEAEAERVLDAMLAKEPDVLIHLGDIYPSGTEKECMEHFYDIIRGKKKCTLPVYTIPGNHDYYSGGNGFYKLIDILNIPAQRQAASFFCLRNSKWQLLAMDTGYNDAEPLKPLRILRSLKGVETSLRSDEVDWHRHQLTDAGDRKTILLSHHQLFSAYEQIGKPKNGESVNSDLKKTFDSYFPKQATSEPIWAWFWGHEHDFVEFERDYQDLPFANCLGHGAIPVDSKKKPRPGKIPYKGLPSKRQTTGLHTDSGGYYNHGFSILTLDSDGSARIDHYEVDSVGKSLSPSSQNIC